MGRIGGYFLALFWTALLGSFLNAILWFIMYQIDPPLGFNFDIGLYVIAFFLGSFLSFFAAIPGFLVAYFWENRMRKLSIAPHLMIYAIYLLLCLFYLGWKQWDTIIGFHVYVVSGIFCSYMFNWRYELNKESGLIDDSIEI
jgi:hypothetical protein